MALDDTDVYQLIAAINDLKREIEKLRSDMEDLRQAVNKNTRDLGNR